MSSIRYEETTTTLDGMADHDAVATRLDLSRQVTLRFSLRLERGGDLDALRYARRVMIREERTRGLEWEEPSMEQPVLTETEIEWVVLVSQVGWCREKISELVSRANRASEELRRLSDRGGPA